MKVWFLVFVLIILPQSVNAGGFWQTDKTICNGTDGVGCGPCDVVKLGKVILDWLLVIGPTIAAIIIVYAGIRLVISKGNPAEKEAAKKIMTNAIVGLVILLAAWLLVDTVMKAIGQTGWYKIECVSNLTPKQPVSKIKAYLTAEYMNCDIIGIDSSGNPTYDCAAQATQCVAKGGSSALQGDGAQVTCVMPSTASGGGSCDLVTDPNNVCHPSKMGCFSNADHASQVCNLESSGGNSSALSGSDLCQDNKSFSVGTWQINLLVNAHLISGCDGVAAFGSQSQPGCAREVTNSKGFTYCAQRKCSVKNQSAYNNCVALAQDPATNQAAACKLYQTQGRGAWVSSVNRCNAGGM